MVSESFKARRGTEQWEGICVTNNRQSSIVYTTNSAMFKVRNTYKLNQRSKRNQLHEEFRVNVQIQNYHLSSNFMLFNNTDSTAEVRPIKIKSSKIHHEWWVVKDCFRSIQYTLTVIDRLRKVETFGSAYNGIVKYTSVTPNGFVLLQFT